MCITAVICTFNSRRFESLSRPIQTVFSALRYFHVRYTRPELLFTEKPVGSSFFLQALKLKKQELSAG